MAALTPQVLVNAGTKPNFALNTPTVSDTAVYGSSHNTFVVYKNTLGTPVTITIAVQGNTSYGQPNPSAVYTVAATTGEVWIPLRSEYDNLSGGAPSGSATLAATGTITGLTVALVQMP